MIHKTATKVVAMLLCVVLLLSAIPMTALAAIPNWESENVTYDKTTFGTNGYYNVISQKDYVLVPGAATETEMVLNNADGTRRQVLHIIEVDPSNPDVSLVPGYYNIDKDVTDVNNQQTAKLTDMAKYYEEKLGYNIVGGMNTDLTYSSNAPRILIYNGADMRVAATVTSSVLCVYQAEDGTVSVDVKAYSKATMDAELADGHATRGKLLHAIGVSFGMVVKDGELVKKTEERTSAAAARSMVGVKKDGTLVIVMNDGRGANNSVGFCDYEEGEAMLALGCEWAANCDGGGSSTFITKRVGEETFTMRSVPCDGAERPTLHGIFVTSNIGPTGELDYAEIEADYDFFAPTSAYKFGVKGIDTNGYQMDLPADAVWTLSDASFGEMTADGTFLSNGTIGDVDIQMAVGDKVIGSRTIHVVAPTTLKLSATSTIMPYTTVEKVRQITLPIVMISGMESPMYYDTNVFDVKLSNEAAGTLDAFKFTSTSDESIAGVTVTLTYKPANTVLTYEIEFGKGSEIVYDFEDGDISNFMSFDEAKQWAIDNNVTNSLVGTNPIGGQFSPDADGSTFLASVDNGGQVKNGQYALGWNVDRTAAFGHWDYNILFNVGVPVVLRDVANGKKAISFGMWVYVPEGAPGMALQLQVYQGTSAETAKGGNIHFYLATLNGSKTLNACTEADIPESRWVYASASLTANYVSLVDPYKNTWGREPSFIRTYVQSTEAAVRTFYFDDFALDYSSAVDDRVAPTFSDFTYDPYVDSSYELKDGMTITQQSVYGVCGFGVKVSDASPVIEESRKITIDGVPVHTSFTNGRIYCTEHFLLPGTHTITFEIADEMGNVGKASKTFTIADADPFITLSGHNDSGTPAEYDSIYYIDLNVSDLSKVGDKLMTTLKLQNANTWETQGAIVAPGFTASFEFNENSDLLDVVVERNGQSVAEGAATLISIPVRVWSWNAINHVTGQVITPESQFASGYCPIVKIACEIVYGNMEGSGYNEATMGAFGGSFSVATNLNDIVNPWHYHDAELSVLSKDATCTESGYAGRTYCETCKSVVDWGTIVEAAGHAYVLTDGQFVCSECDDVLVLGTGLVTVNGKLYYAIAGKLVSGWYQIGEDWYCFRSSNMAAVTGYYYLGGGLTYYFNEDGTLSSGEWIKDDIGYRYFYGPTCYRRSWVTIDGNTYAFDDAGYAYTNKQMFNFTNGPKQAYIFSDTGVLLETVTDSGIFVDSNGDIWYLDNGKSSHAGLVEVDGDFYYFNSSGKCVKGQYYVGQTNGYLNEGYCYFGQDGKMYNGIYQEDDGYYYYRMGRLYAAGLINVDGAFYYIDSSCKAVTGTYYVTRVNDTGFAVGNYTFGADGKMCDGIVEENGVLYYYASGAKYFAGLIEIDGALYYVNTDGKLATGQCYVSKVNDTGFAAGNYTFGADGKMCDGLVNENGGLYYYEKGVKKNPGMIEIDGAIYYIKSNGQAVTGMYYASRTNGMMPADSYIFGEDGKMLNNTFAVWQGTECFIRNGRPVAAGAVEVDGEVYFIRSGCQKAKGVYYVGGKGNGILEEGYFYLFNEDGTLANNEFGTWQGRENYFVMGRPTAAGAVVVDGDIYYIRSSCEKATGRYYISPEKCNGILTPGVHVFDEDGKLIA